MLAGTLPLSAAALSTPAGKAWFKRSVGWIIAFLLYKPAAALVYASAFSLTANAKDLLSVLSGLMLILLSVFALPALMRLAVPMVAAATGGGGGELAVAGVGAALATGARRGGSSSSGGSKSGGSGTGKVNGSSGPDGNSGSGGGSPTGAKPGAGAGPAAPAPSGAGAGAGGGGGGAAGGAAAAGGAVVAVGKMTAQAMKSGAQSAAAGSAGEQS